MGKCVETMWALWGTVGELWELFEVDLRLGSGGATLGKRMVRAEEFQGCPITRW